MINWEGYFPHSEPRDSQVQAIDFILDSIINKDKRFVIIEAGTGVGKSAIGLTVARVIQNHLGNHEDYQSGTYFLTTQKILQEQYVTDFGNTKGKMTSIKSSSNYQCKYIKQNNCGESMRALRTTDKQSAFYKACIFGCIYKQAKEDFINSPESVTNFPYFLAETSYAGKIKPRNVLVVDETHNAPDELSKFIEIAVTERFAKQGLKLTMPIIKTQSQAIKWITDEYSPKLFSHTKHIEKMMEKYVGLKDKLNEFAGLAKQYDLLDKHACKLRRFLELYNKENWVCNIVPAEGRAGRRLEFKPIDVAPYAGEMLLRYGRKVIMMSATILDKDAYCEMLGIKPSDVEFISIQSPFPQENRPILECNIGSMAAKSIENTLPKLALAVHEILKTHPKEKGIIHCHTFKIANYLKNNVKNNRLLIHNSDNREEILKKHKSSLKPTVLLSPSMTEGVDLKDECSRFQLICKIPYPYLGDKLIRKKMNKWKWWYPLQTAKTIVQATGRSVRSADDHAVTYILDSDWDRFYQRNKRLFPKDFIGCLQ
tara:strand:+ start:7685 stop:9304 length:1620 start_codon:yes stop_codon:yes gene_type:complete